MRVLISLNGKALKVPEGRLTYENIVEMLHPQGTTALLTVAWSIRGRAGTLIPGQHVKVEPGMAVNAVITGAA